MLIWNGYYRWIIDGYYEWNPMDIQNIMNGSWDIYEWIMGYYCIVDYGIY